MPCVARPLNAHVCKLTNIPDVKKAWKYACRMLWRDIFYAVVSRRVEKATSFSTGHAPTRARHFSTLSHRHCKKFKKYVPPLTNIHATNSFDLLSSCMLYYPGHQSGSCFLCVVIGASEARAQTCEGGRLWAFAVGYCLHDGLHDKLAQVQSGA